MDIKQRDIEKFKELYAQHFNVKLTDSVASVRLSMLVRQMEIVCQPLNEAQLKYVNENEHDQESTNRH